VSINWSRESLAWLAGLLEGEGSFVVNDTRPQITVDMTDEDVIRRCHEIAGVGHVYGPYARQRSTTGPRKDLWSWRVSQQLHTYALMVALYPWMGQRRQEKMREIMVTWLSRTRKTDACPPGFFR